MSQDPCEYRANTCQLTKPLHFTRPTAFKLPTLTPLPALLFTNHSLRHDTTRHATACPRPQHKTKEKNTTTTSNHGRTTTTPTPSPPRRTTQPNLRIRRRLHTHLAPLQRRSRPATPSKHLPPNPPRSEQRRLVRQRRVALDHTIPITAHFKNFDFTPLYDWLAENDNRPSEQKRVLRVLDIELALVSPSSGTSGFDSSSLAITRADGEGGGKGDSMVMSRTTALATDRKTILSCDANWVKTLDADLVTLGRATYGADKSTRAKNSQLYIPTGRRRRFAETVAGNGYLTSAARASSICITRVSPSSKTPTTPTPAHSAFIHSADYFATLTPLLSPSPPSTPTASQLCAHALCVRRFRRRIYLGLLKSQTQSQKLKWDRKYYSSLTPEAQKVVRFYRLLDPLPKAKLNSLRAAFGAKVVASGRKRGVGEVYASGKGFWMGFGGEGGVVDRA